MSAIRFIHGSQPDSGSSGSTAFFVTKPRLPMPPSRAKTSS